MGNRDLLVPEVPRTKHVGGGGVHVTGLEQVYYHGQRPLNAQQFVTLDVEGLEALAIHGDNCTLQHWTNHNLLYVYVYFIIMHSASPHHASRVHRVREERYLQAHHTAIMKAEVVRITEHPCKVFPLPRRKVSSRRYFALLVLLPPCQALLHNDTRHHTTRPLHPASPPSSCRWGKPS